MDTTKLAAAFPAFDLATLPALPDAFVDHSWHNDAMPMFIHETLGLALWIDYADTDLREHAEGCRFILEQMEASPDGWQHTAQASDALEYTDDIALILAKVERIRIGKAYEELVGYDLFEDDPTMSTADGLALLTEVQAMDDTQEAL